MYRFYQVVFLVGLIYTSITFILGFALDFFDFGFDSDTSFDTDLEGDLSLFTISPLKPIIIVSFITTFGGMGMLGYHWKWIALKTFIVALIIASSVSYGLYSYIIVPLYKIQAKNIAVKKEDIVGKKAEVINAILENGYGKISYIVNQSRYTGTARSINGFKIEQNKEVLIVRMEENVFYVKTLINLKKT